MAFRPSLADDPASRGRPAAPPDSAPITFSKNHLPRRRHSGPPCWTEFSSFYDRFSRGKRGKSKNRPKNRIFGLVEPRSAVFRPYFHVLAVAEASSRPLRVFCSDNWVSPLPSIIFRNPIILSSWVQRQRSPSRRLRRVRWNALFNAFIFRIFMPVGPKNQKIGRKIAFLGS